MWPSTKSAGRSYSGDSRRAPVLGGVRLGCGATRLARWREYLSNAARRQVARGQSGQSAVRYKLSRLARSTNAENDDRHDTKRDIFQDGWPCETRLAGSLSWR